MEVPKGLQDEIFAVQNKLQNAILEHQTYVKRLKDDPNNTDIIGQIQKMQMHIVSLGKCQKQVVQRLRKEVEAFKANNANGSKVSLSFLGLNNNNHITNNNETRCETAANGFETKPKEDYEKVVRNGDVHHSPVRDNDCANSVETISGEDDVVEVSMDENSCEKKEVLQAEDTELTEKENFLGFIGLLTKAKCMELQNKRVERKRRSTANPHFIYSMLEQPSKRKRHSYLQSGNAPHTRQTTARLNGPSPPPSKAQRNKSISPPAQTVTKKSLIPVQKSTTRPNILRNADSKVFVNKNKVEENQVRSSISSAKSIQSIGNKAVHIPGLPSSLTIERIGNDSVVCICCRNPGSLMVCKNCSSNYHVSCHSRSPAPFRICPKCVMDEGEDIEKDDKAEVKSQAEEENKLARYRKDEKLGKSEEKERERYELRERNSDLRLQVYELEKRSQLLGQSLQLQHRTRQELVGKQEKTQRSIKRLVDFIKLIQLRKSACSPTPSASTSCPRRPSSSQSVQTVVPPLQTHQRATSSPRSSKSNNDKTSYPATLTSSSTSTRDRVSPTFSKRRIKCLTPTSCPAPLSSQRSTNHTLSSRKSPSRLESPINQSVARSKIKAAPQFSTVNCLPVTLPLTAATCTLSSPTPCSSTAVTTVVRSRAIVQSQRSTGSLPCQNCQIPFSPSRTTINWTERPSTVENPGPSLHAASSALISQSNVPPKPCRPFTATPRPPTSICNDQSQPDQSRKQQQQQQQQQRVSAVVVSTGQEPAPSSTRCSQAITSPIPSPAVHAASVQTTETIRSCGSSSAARSTSWSNSRANSQTSQQQQSSSSGAPLRDSSNT